MQTSTCTDPSPNHHRTGVSSAAIGRIAARKARHPGRDTNLPWDTLRGQLSDLAEFDAVASFPPLHRDVQQD